MDAATRQLVEALHAHPRQCVLALTGGGTTAAALLLGVPGASRTVLEVQIPYDDQALVQYLGRRPEQFCSAATGRELAVRSWERARWLAPGHDVVGVGCTASLATDRPKRGPHRFHVAVATSAGVTSFALTLTKGARDREGEEAVLDAVLLNALAEAFGVGARLTLSLLPGEALETETLPVADPLGAFFRREAASVCVEPDGRVRQDAAPPPVVLAGAFNPAHHGHWGMGAAAGRMVGQPVAFELSVTNVDKPPLGAAEVCRRLHQFAWRAPLWLTRAPTYVEKAALFPGVVFVVGADTAARIIAPRYYGDSAARMAEGLASIRERGCRFLVAGRAGADAAFLRLADLALPTEFRDLFTEIPEQAFRLDISSTALRAGENG
jgi:hypothetical protein